MNPNITTQLLGWNSAKVLAKTLPALAAIPAEQSIFRYIDNNSEDDSIAIVKKYLPQAEIIALPKNVGFTGGHNVGLAACTTPYVLVLNPDVTIQWTGITRLLAVFEKNPRLAAIQGLLLRPGQPQIVDSAGIVRTITLNGVDRGAGKPTGTAFTTPTQLDAVTGACSVFRMSALTHVTHGEYSSGGYAATEVFDRDFFAYKEDVDLGWRLQTAGWQVAFEPVSVGVHGRQLQPQGRFGWKMEPAAILARLRNQRTRMSLRNYIWLVVKNASWTQLLFHEVFIDFRLSLFFLISLVYWPLLLVWPEALRGIPNMLHKRSHEVVNNHR